MVATAPPRSSADLTRPMALLDDRRSRDRRSDHFSRDLEGLTRSTTMPPDHDELARQLADDIQTAGASRARGEDLEAAKAPGIDEAKPEPAPFRQEVLRMFSLVDSAVENSRRTDRENAYL